MICIKLNKVNLELDIFFFLCKNVERSFVKVKDVRCDVSFFFYLRILNVVKENEIKNKRLEKIRFC